MGHGTSDYSSLHPLVHTQYGYAHIHVHVFSHHSLKKATEMGSRIEIGEDKVAISLQDIRLFQSLFHVYC